MISHLEESMIRTNGIDLHVMQAGSPGRPAVIFLHGFPEFWRSWYKQIDALVGQGYHVIIPDQRGYNLSDVPSRVEDYSLETLSADIIGLMDHFGLENVDLVGHDWGAAVAWHLGMKYPQRIRNLVIMNVPHPAVMFSHLSKSPRQMLRSWYIGFFQIPWLADWLLSIANFSGALALLKYSGLPSTFSQADLEEYRQAYQNSHGLTGMINWYRAITRFRPSRLPNMHLQMPVLILWGRKDVALSAEMAQASLKLCDDGRLIYFDNATHWVQHDEAEDVNRHLLEFIQEHTGQL